jgi:rhodanese-related sulfurtransferase
MIPSIVHGLLALFLFSNYAVAGDVSGNTLPESKRTQAGLYLTVKEAYDLVQKEGQHVLFIDVRSRAEVATLGMPTVADANVPFMEMTAIWDDSTSQFKMQPNDFFAVGVKARLKQKGLKDGDKVILMCRSGERSAAASDVLSKAGLKSVYSVTDGFEGDLATSGPDAGKRVVNGWKNSGLPWTYELKKEKLICLNCN